MKMIGWIAKVIHLRGESLVNMKHPSSGFLDIDFRPIIEYKTLNKDGKWEKKTRKRKRELQALLEMLRKEIGSPCKVFAVNCPVCETWSAFARIDQFFED